MTGYEMYRGKCHEMSEALVKENPNLRLVRGFYYCPLRNRKVQHWWTQDTTTGEIIDPTAAQFPSNGQGTYTEFDGMCACDECGKKFREDDSHAVFEGRYALCSSACFQKFVGL